MKKLLLISFLLITFTFFHSASGQNPDTPTDDWGWQFQPVKIETFLYNTSVFDDFGLGNRTENDSVPESITEFEYDNELITTTSSAWIEGEWEMQFKTHVYVKNEMQVDSMIMLAYDTTQTSWEINFKIENEYEGDKQTETRSYSADSLTGDWNLLSQTDYEYNNSGHLTTEIMSTWSPDSNKLIASSKKEYYFNAEGKVDSTTNYFRVPVINQWQANTATKYMYSSEGDAEEHITYSRDFMTQAWTKTTKTELHFNAEGNQYLRNEYNWDPEADAWLITTKDSTVYEDDATPLVQISYQKPLLENELYIRNKTFFTYDAASNVPETVLKNEILVYPNPAARFISVQTRQPENHYIRLFDLSGKLVFERTATEKTTQIPVQNLTEGSYLLKVRTENANHAQIVIIR